MKIEHAAIYVRDLETVKDFYISFFDAEASDKYYNPLTGFESYFLEFEGGTRLELMRSPGLQELQCSAEYFGYSHIAFSAGSRERVDELTASLEAQGYRIASYPRITGDGYYESCILDPEGNRVEITA